MYVVFLNIVESFSLFRVTFPYILSQQQEDCEKAYYKMDNVLIDDRRIHVDFSQSVAKIKWKGKGTLAEASLFFSHIFPPIYIKRMY